MKQGQRISAMLSASLAIFFLAACGDSDSATPEHGTNTDAAPDGVEIASQSVAAGPTENAPPAAFAQCAACHKVDKPSHQGIGPHLVGVYGAKAGSRGDYDYSPALKESGLVWDTETLDAYIQSPQRVVSGTKMAFGGVSNAQDRKEIIAYLAELK